MPSLLSVEREDEHSGKGRGTLWLFFLGLAIVEIVGHVVVQRRVVHEADWARAAARVRAEFREGDLIVAAPHWADPLVREQLGDLITLEAAGRSDLAQYDRVWALSIRGHRPAEAPDEVPELDELIGKVRVLRWRLSRGNVLYDFSEHVRDASVSLVRDDSETPCRFQSSGRPSGGGLGAGAITAAERHVCDPQRPWLWVGNTVLDDLELRPRYCIWQHPAGPSPIRASFPDVPLGEQLVLYGDIYYEHERNLEHGPIDVVVRVDGEEIGRMIHRDGDGWKRMVASTRTRSGAERGVVTIEVSAENPHLRSFCWAATTRGAER